VVTSWGTEIYRPRTSIQRWRVSSDVKHGADEHGDRAGEPRKALLKGLDPDRMDEWDSECSAVAAAEVLHSACAGRRPKRMLPSKFETLLAPGPLLLFVRSGNPAGGVTDALRSAISRIRAGGLRSVAAYDDRR